VKVDLTFSKTHLASEHVTTLQKLLRITTWLLQFIDKLRKQATKNGPLTASELQRAKLIWDLYIQNRYYSEVIQKNRAREEE